MISTKILQDLLSYLEAEVNAPIPAVTDKDIEIEAHRLWMERGCPLGDPDTDWQNAKVNLCYEIHRTQLRNDIDRDIIIGIKKELEQRRKK